MMVTMSLPESARLRNVAPAARRSRLDRYGNHDEYEFLNFL